MWGLKCSYTYSHWLSPWISVDGDWLIKRGRHTSQGFCLCRMGIPIKMDTLRMVGIEWEWVWSVGPRDLIQNWLVVTSSVDQMIDWQWGWIGGGGGVNPDVTHTHGTWDKDSRWMNEDTSNWSFLKLMRSSSSSGQVKTEDSERMLMDIDCNPHNQSTVHDNNSSSIELWLVKVYWQDKLRWKNWALVSKWKYWNINSSDVYVWSELLNLIDDDYHTNNSNRST